MDNNDLFIKLYNQLDNLLVRHYKLRDRNTSLIMRYAIDLQRSAYKQTYERGRKLNLIRVIRNLMVHDLDMNADRLIEITPDLVAFLEKEIALLSHPQTAFDIATKIEVLFCVSPEDLIIDKLPIMIKRGNMQVPVLDEKKQVVGVFSPNTLLLYLNEHPGYHKDLKIAQLVEYLSVHRHVSEYYEFVPKDFPSEQVADLFDEYYKKGKKLVMVFVTEHGKESESLLGLITPYDVVNLGNK
ncbi:MAG TPA: hypothetical protein PKO28_03105 [Bacilli bacterium]|nr:hypothetical protein [Bacilli bacterium]